MNSRERLLHTLDLRPGVAPPRFGSEFAPETLAAWTVQGYPAGAEPEAHFGFDRCDTVPVEWRRLSRDKRVVCDEDALAEHRQAFNPVDSRRFPENWAALREEWKRRDYALDAEPWNEGFLQVIGISDGRSLNNALVQLCEQPGLMHAAMDHYATYLETLLKHVTGAVGIDYAIFYEPIASNHGPVLSPEMYRRFAIGPIEQVARRLESGGTRYRFVWTSGNVWPLIPLWLDAGINGVILTHTVASGVGYPELRQRFGQELRLMGGVDWHILMLPPREMDRALEEHVRPLLEQGGYIPHVDDTIRPYVTYDAYRAFRERLDRLTERVGSR